MKKEKIAIVTQRCHPQALGGSEAHAWQYAQLLQDQYEVDILTTCAIDAELWEPVIKPGWTEREGIQVRHFKNQTGHTSYWSKLHEQLLQAYRNHMYDAKIHVSSNVDRHLLDWSWTLQAEWVRAQGPHSIDLLNYLQVSHSEYKKIIFVTYLFSPTCFGIHKVPKNKSILVPTLHDEPPAWLPIYKAMAKQAGYILWNTKTEQELGYQLWGALQGEIVAMAVEPYKNKMPKKAAQIEGPYFLYLGRIDAGKGCQELIEYFIRFNENRKQKIPLLFAGVLQMELPKTDLIRYIGFVSEEEKYQYLDKATALMMPSPNESLSLVTLEALVTKCPIVVTANNPVLLEHINNSSCGYSYQDFESFNKTLEDVLEGVANDLLQAGQNYVLQNYSNDAVTAKLRRVINL